MEYHNQLQRNRVLGICKKHFRTIKNPPMPEILRPFRELVGFMKEPAGF